MRQVVLDTETTGLEYSQGHRIIEIGCVEVNERKLTGRRFHIYLNPERDIDAGAVAVHGLSRDFLSDKPKFAAIADDFLAFVKGAELIIHNAPFDVGFLNHEFRLLAAEPQLITDYCTVLDTLALAKKMHPGQRNNLDALCRRYGIDNSHRDLHGALLDAEILAEVYLAMTGGQTLLLLETETPETKPAAGSNTQTAPSRLASGNRPPLSVIRATDAERTAHEQRLAEIGLAAKGRCLWNEPPP